MSSGRKVCPVWIGGRWVDARSTSSFHAYDPSTGEALDDLFPISEWADCDEALAAAAACFTELKTVPRETIADFLELYAASIEERQEEIVAMAARETALAVSPRLAKVELPRTTDQLRQAAKAVRDGSWTGAVIDTARNIRSHHAPLGPVVVFGPNNFPFAYNGISGGDFAAAIAAGNPVIAKSHPSHPGTSRLLAEQAYAALGKSGLPGAMVQMLYGVSNEDGLRLVADARIAAVGFTGSRDAGMRLKTAAESTGRLIYLEMSSINPIVILPGAMQERGAAIAAELVDSCLLGVGQFCTSPNMIVLPAGGEAEAFVEVFVRSFSERQPGVLLSASGLKHLQQSTAALQAAGASTLVGGNAAEGPGYRFQNTVLRTSGEQWLQHKEALQREAFGNTTLLVVARDVSEMTKILDDMEGNLTGSIYSSTAGEEDDYAEVERILRYKVGRLLNDRPPTGVAVSPAMQHGGPYPATSQPGFTAVGFPASLLRFSQLHCYDAVREERLPADLRDKTSNARTWRQVDGEWTRGDLSSAAKG